MRSLSFGSGVAAAVSVAVLVLAASVNGCGSEDSAGGDNQGTSGATTSGGFGASGGTSGTSGTSGGGTSGGDGTCARGSGQTGLQPLDLFIMFDQSLSMRRDRNDNIVDNADCNTTTNPPNASRWCKSVVALSQYLNSVAATGNRAALQFFGPSSGACNGDSLARSVEPGGNSGYRDLPTNLFDDDLNQAAPDQSTPLEGAVRGLIAFTARPENRVAGRRTVGVLITDADTDSLTCSKDINAMRDLLQKHFTDNRVQTFIIGMTGAEFSVLETLATGGNGVSHPDQVGVVTNACGNGAGPCLSWNVGNGDGNALAEALKVIQQSAVGCTLRMPKPETGTLDLNQIQVEYSPGGSPNPTQLTRVTNAAACAPKGFYYDNNDTPSTIELCPEICATVSADPKAKIEVIAACVRGATTGTGGVDLK